MLENDEELRKATQQLDEVKSALKGECPPQGGANIRAQSAEPAVVSLDVAETNAKESKEKDKGKDRSRSTSRGRSDKVSSTAGKDANVVGMRAAIARICVLGQELEALQINSTPQVSQAPSGKGDGKAPTTEIVAPKGDGVQASKGTGGHDKPGGRDEYAMEVEPIAPTLGDTLPHSAQTPGT
eukprot:373885-Amphidinium_carterae.1